MKRRDSPPGADLQIVPRLNGPRVPAGIAAFGRELTRVLAASSRRIEELGKDISALPVAQWAEPLARLSTPRESLDWAGWVVEQIPNRPPADQLELARLAARLAESPAPHAEDRLEVARRADTLGRAGLAEVRALRRLGRLQEAVRGFVDLDAGFGGPDSPLFFWLSLAADRDLTAALLLRDQGHVTEAYQALERADRILSVAASEDEEAAYRLALARTDLAAGVPSRAIERLRRWPQKAHRSRQLEAGFLAAEAALILDSPLPARRALLELARALKAAPRADLDRFQVLEAALKLREGRPVAALEKIGGPAERLCAAGSLLGTLRAALVACRGELVLRRFSRARQALAAGVLLDFQDLPATGAVLDGLDQVADEAKRRIPRADFLRRLEVWLVLVEDSPGLSLQKAPRTRGEEQRFPS